MLRHIHPVRRFHAASPRTLFVLLVALLAMLLGGCGMSDEGATSDKGYYSPDGGQSQDTWGGSGDTTGSDTSTGGNTNVSLGGAQDFGYFRGLLQAGIVPSPADIDAAGFFAEHHTALPEPDCGNRVCVQAMLGVMGNLINGANCTMLQIGLNSPLTIDPANRPPLQLAVVVDVSGSMAIDGKMDFVRQGLQRMVNELDDTDEIAIITYSSDAQVVFPLAAVGQNRNALLDIISGLRPDGGTNIYDGLQLGYSELQAHYDSGVQNRLIMLSDGQATAGNTSTQAIIDMSRAFNSEGLGLTTVGLGTDFNLGLMRGLAEQSDGNFYFLEDSSAVDEVFTQELSYFTVPVAFDVTITVEEGSHYTFGGASGSNLWQDTASGGRLEVPSVFLAHRVSADDVTPDGERRGGGSALLIELMPREGVDATLEAGDVAKVTFSYREPGSDQIVEETVFVEYPHAPNLLLEQGFFDNLIVTKSFVMLNILEALRESTLRFHAGDMEGAVALLRRVIAAASDYEDGVNDGMGDTDIRFDIELMESLAQVMLQAGASEPVDPEIPENPWPAD